MSNSELPNLKIQKKNIKIPSTLLGAMLPTTKMLAFISQVW